MEGGVPVAWLIGGVLGGLIALGGLMSTPKQFREPGSMGVFARVVAFVLSVAIGAFVVGVGAWLLFEVTLPLLFGS
jgi:hypothetical protein